MEKEIKEKRFFSECFFEYKISIGKDELGIKENLDILPKIYLEKKDLESPKMFFTFPEWYDPIQTTEEKEYIYDEVEYIFDPKGYDLKNIFNRSYSETERDSDMKSGIIKYNDSCIKTSGRYDIEVLEYSGVGAFRLMKRDKQTIVYFGINYATKKKIYYEIFNNKIKFRTLNDLDSIKVRIYQNVGRVACLIDEEINYRDANINFNNHKAKISIKRKNDEYIYVDFGGEENEKTINSQIYQLICEKNHTTPKDKINKRVLEEKRICPYCHDEISFDNSIYKNGMYCDGEPIKEFNIYNNGIKQKNFIVCKKCKTINNGKIAARPFRMLPDKIMKKNNYRLAILGMARSGKTTFISKLLNVSASSNETLIQPEKYDFFKLFNIKFYAPNLLSRSKNSNSDILDYNIQPTPYYSSIGADVDSKNFFSKYSISIENKKFIAPTVTGTASNTTKFPFILDINNKAYLNIYDISGEDVENGSTVLTTITKGRNISLILVLDLSKSIEDNEVVLKNAQKVYEEYKSTCPIAIVMSKFDIFEKYFSSNCACLNADYAHFFVKNLNNSAIINHINTASDEIESYLKKKNMDIRNTYFKGFNIKFFSVSSITYKDAMYHEDNADKTLEKNGLNFMCSSKRIELPLLWILHELGEI